ncbi:arginine metabolism regulation protein II [Trichomonascus vanleenenianus]|uniref:Zn(II)2Cys6 transcription factor n=1 Tax=Trichomonascus vanleenenianus TaxID=2268995 RepID=UPI003EC9C222
MPIARTKTFTGCWTCRSRKIKCDLRRPACLRCEKADIHCEGYTIRLSWNNSRSKTQDEDFFQRRNVEFVEYPPEMMYETYEDMDITLAKLHSPRFVTDETVSLGPFGVFDGIKKRKANDPLAGGSRKGSNAAKRRKSAKGTEKLAKRVAEGSSGSPGVASSSPATSTPATASTSTDTPDDYSLLNQPTPQPTPPGSLTPEGTNTTGNGNGAASSSSSTGSANIVSTSDSLTLLISHVPDQRSDKITSVNAPDTSQLEHGFFAGPGAQEKNHFDDFLTSFNPTETNLFSLDYQALQDELSSLLAGDSHMTFGATFDTLTDNNENTAMPIEQAGPSNTLTTIDPTSATGATNHDMIPVTNLTSDYKSSLFERIQCSPVQYMLSTDNKFGFPTASLYLTSQARYLLDYYVRKVSRIMTVMKHPKNPWDTIYLPVAFSAVGDITSSGHTASARSALLHALLSVSAYHLSSKFPEGTDEKAHYSSLGLQLKSEAYRWLSECLMKDLGSQKYKDVVTAVLSMASIDVISGGMADCQIHLSACKSIVNMRFKTRPKVSNKAATLHRISGFLSLMQSATALDPASILELNESRPFNDQWLDVRLEDFDVAASHQSTNSSPPIISDYLNSLSYMNDPSQFQEYWHQYNPGTTASLSDDFYRKELVSTQSLYGIPDSLLLLFSRTCKLTRQALFFQNNNKTTQVDSRMFLKECSDLEAALVSWQTRYDVNKHNDFKGEAKEAVNHHTLAFHQSLIIYYYRLVRGINSAILEPHILNVLDHLEHIQMINRGKPEPVCVPVMFPGFIAACETTMAQADLRNRFRGWLDQQTVEGVGTYISARRVIDEVWRRRDTGRQDADWWKVIVEWNMNLMLS